MFQSLGVWRHFFGEVSLYARDQLAFNVLRCWIKWCHHVIPGCLPFLGRIRWSINAANSGPYSDPPHRTHSGHWGRTRAERGRLPRLPSVVGLFRRAEASSTSMDPVPDGSTSSSHPAVACIDLGGESGCPTQLGVRRWFCSPPPPSGSCRVFSFIFVASLLRVARSGCH